MTLVEFLKSNKKRTGIIFSIAILVVGVVPLLYLTFFADPAHPYSINPITLTSEDGTQIQALVYRPINVATTDLPGVVTAHGYCGSKGSLQKLAIELVKREFVVVNIDFRGHGSSGGYLDENLEMDVLAAVDYLKSLGIDDIGLMGHSMGAGTVRSVVEKNPNEIIATVSMGSIPSNTSSVIPNLLVALGQFEQGGTPAKGLNFLKGYLNRNDVTLDTLYGDFEDGSAVKVAIGPFSEHLYERTDPVILYEIVQWFELAFYGSVRWEIVVTAFFNSASFYIAVFGTVCLCFVVILYLSNYMWKDQTRLPRKELVKNTSTVRLILYYILVGIIGLLSYQLFSGMFTDVMPVSSGDQLFAIYLGTAVGTMVIYYLLILRKEFNSAERKLGFKDFPSKMKELVSENSGRSLFYGIIVAILLTVAINSITHWSESPYFPTIREIGTIIGLTLLFFPILFVKEFYFRTVQSKLNFSNRFKEYFAMVGIGIFLDNLASTVVMILTWGNASGALSFIALSLTVTLGMSIIQQILVTWVYMYSGRNIIGSTIFLSIFYSWIIINFFPFT